MSEEAITVAVRVRPFNDRELALQDGGKSKRGCCLTMPSATPGKVILRAADYGTQPEDRPFDFDYAYWSHTKDDDNCDFADQKKVNLDLGTLYLDNVFAGFNCSLFAYGQTGAGKSYTMTGPGDDPGIIPLGCRQMFDRIANNEDPSVKFEVAVSFMEIYNEQVRDLLNAKATAQPRAGLKVREIPDKGFYVQGLTKRDVANYESIEKWMEIGSKQRTVASTKMNATSSRSHSIFVIYFTKRESMQESDGETCEGVCTSEVNLVDLAGCERTEKTGAKGQTLKEANAINQSLTTLGNVIKALHDLQVEKEKGSKKKAKAANFVPYRNSVLTKLLKASLGGNAKTIMVAAISPSWDNYEETLSTLRYAWRAKAIKTKAVKNKQRSKAEIEAAFQELERLKYMIEEEKGGVADDRLSAEFEYHKEEWERLEITLADRLQSSQSQMLEIMHALADSGISFKEMGGMLRIAMDTPHFTNIGPNVTHPEEPFIYFLLNQTTVVRGLDEPPLDMFDENSKGSASGETSKGEMSKTGPVPGDIVLIGKGLSSRHAVIDFRDGVVQIAPNDDSTDVPHIQVNGETITKTTTLEVGDRVVLGKYVIWRYGRGVDDTGSSSSPNERQMTWKQQNNCNVTVIDFEAENKRLKEEIAKLKASKACVLL